MDDYMPLPKYYGLVRIVAQIGALVGCLVGLFIIVGGLGVFKYGVGQGIAAVSGGVYAIILSLAGLGITYGFLAIVKASVDSRNFLYELRSAQIKETVPEEIKIDPIL